MNNFTKYLIIGLIVAFFQYLFVMFSPIDSTIVNSILLIIIVLLCSYLLETDDNKKNKP